MEKWKKQILCCGLIALVNVVPVCYVLWRLGDTIRDLDTEEISTSLEQIHDEMGKIGNLLSDISSSLGSLDLDAFGDRINTTIQQMKVSVANPVPAHYIP